MSIKWDEETDFLVVGSGAGGMSAALVAHDLGAKALVIEKSEYYGGSSAMSGGTIWVPANSHMLNAGIHDSADDGFDYLKEVTEGKASNERIRAYVNKACEMLDYLEKETDVNFSPMLKYPDYYTDAPGAKLGGRTIEPLPFDGNLLDDEFFNMRPPHPQILIMNSITMTAGEAHDVTSGSFSGKMFLLGLIVKYLLNVKTRKKYKRSTRLALGNGLIGRIRFSMLKRNIPIWLNITPNELIMDDSRVVGLSVQRNGKTINIHAKKGVLMAAGGFERNQQMRDQYQQKPVSTTWTAAHQHNTGDAIRMGQAVGAELGMMSESWANTTTLVPGKEMSWLLVMEKNKPGSIMVNSAGKRFTNEGAPYSNVANDMYKTHQAGTSCIPAYLVFDADYRKKNPCGPVMPGMVKPDSRLDKRIRNEFLKKGETLEELANKIQVPADSLKATVERFNHSAEVGKDEDFGRGETPFDQYYGDPKVKPNPNLGAITKPPFYAIEVNPGDVGTKGGILTDDLARALDTHGNVIPGLYATGNCSASMMGSVCPGAGATIGPAMTFGYIAAHDAVGANIK